MLVGALFAPMLVSRVPAGTIIIGGLAVSAIGVLLGLIPTHEPLLLALVLAGIVFLIPAINAALMGYFMVATPTQMLGRANSASAVLGMGALPLAPLVAGIGLSLIGRESTLIAAAVMPRCGRAARDLERRTARPPRRVRLVRLTPPSSRPRKTEYLTLTQWQAGEQKHAVHRSVRTDRPGDPSDAAALGHRPRPARARTRGRVRAATAPTTRRSSKGCTGSWLCVSSASAWMTSR